MPKISRTAADLVSRLTVSRHDPSRALKLIYQMFAKLLSWTGHMSAPTPPTRSRSSSHAIKLAVLQEFDLFPHANSTVAVSLDLRHERGPGPAMS